MLRNSYIKPGHAVLSKKDRHWFNPVIRINWLYSSNIIKTQYSIRMFMCKNYLQLRKTKIEFIMRLKMGQENEET